MIPKFKDVEAWKQAEQLMQPTLIRLLDNIRKQADRSDWQTSYEDVQTPIPGYHLHLDREGQHLTFDVWEMCYQICFRDYAPTKAEAESQEANIDASLIEETGEVDWNRLDTKAKQLVERLFDDLPK